MTSLINIAAASLITVTVIISYQIIRLYLRQRSHQCGNRTWSHPHSHTTKKPMSIHYHDQYHKPQKGYLVVDIDANNLDTLMIYLHGKSGLALDWMPFTENAPSNCAHLLIEYPGVGENQGHFSEVNNIHAILSAIDAAHQKLNKTLVNHHMVGHSLGCSLALRTAQHLPHLKNIPLISPFWDAIEASATVLGKTVAKTTSPLLLWDTYENHRYLEKLKQTKPNISMRFIHGQNDTYVPVSDSLRLYKLSPNWITLYIIQGLNHELAYYCIPLVYQLIFQQNETKTRA